MTRKELVLRMVQKLEDDVSYDRVIYHLGVMKGVEIGLEQAERGEGIEHEEFMDQLLGGKCQESESDGRRTPKKTSPGSTGGSRKTRRSRRSPSSIA